MKYLFRWGNLIMLIAMVVVNSMANIIPLGGKTTGEISAQYPTLFTPAPYTFSIWGLIYILMSACAIYIAFLNPDNKISANMRGSIGILFMLSCIFNILWILSWHKDRIGLSVICILGLLVTLIIINMRFTIYYNISVPERIFVYGFNIYLGWICAATIANIGVFLTKVEWTRFGLSSQTWTIIVLIVAGVLGIAFVCSCRYAAAFAMLWAIAGIFINHVSDSGFNNAYPVITITLVCVFVAITISMLLYPFISSSCNTYKT